MNDNDRLNALNAPEWAWDIVERHDLALRSDTPLAAVIVLLADAAFDLKMLSETAFSQQALSPKTQRQVSACAVMIEDALKLAKLSPSEATGGNVQEDENGTLAWTPLVQPTSADTRPPEL